MVKLNNIIYDDSFNVLKTMPDNCIDSIVTDPPYGWKFMNKKWDYDIPKVEFWKECLRVLKPGAYILVACGTKTQHRMVVNLEDAGFEIRDIVAWIYGSGFPKSLDIGKQIDKIQGNKRNVIGRNTNSRENCNKTNTLFEHGLAGKTAYITKGNSEYEGWGTALKPAMELWTLCRKPLSENTVAENILKWGTGGLNIDECRITTDEKLTRKLKSNTISNSGWVSGKRSEIAGKDGGRFPANFIHDGSDEVIDLFPYSKSTDGNDDVSAARFFYCAKASQKERNLGLKDIKNNHPTVKPIALMLYLLKLITPDNGLILDPFCGSGSTIIAAMLLKYKYIGIENVKEYYNLIKNRLSNIDEYKKLFNIKEKNTKNKFW